MFEEVLQQEQMHIVASVTQQRSKLEESFFRAAAPEVCYHQGDFQV